MRTFTAEGIIIKRRDYKDADRMLTVFTRDQGKIVIKAAGVRKITSRRSPHVELLNHASLTLYKGNGYPILTEAQTINGFSAIKGDLMKIGFAYHICELIDGLCPEGQEQASIFSLLLTTLHGFSSPEELAVKIHGFEVRLLTLLGFWNHTTQEEDTHTFIENILERKLKSKRFFHRLQ